METQVLDVLREWEPTVGPHERADPLWGLHAYRVARCLVDFAIADVKQIGARADAKSISQLTRAVSSIGANLAEGYSRRSAADRARFYGYALGSAREAVVWYRGLAWCLDAERMDVRMMMLVQVRRLIVGMLKALQRNGGPAFDPS